MSTKEKTKTATHYRIKIGSVYATLNHELNEKGVPVPGSSKSDGYIFSKKASADAAVSRLYEARSVANASMFPNWKKFDAIRFSEMPEVEPFQIEIPAE